MGSRLRIRLKRGTAGLKEDQRGTLRALGLRRLNQVVEKESVPEIIGMARKVSHLVEIETLEDKGKAKVSDSVNAEDG
ncbi:MAG: 50S ribosomal protein L30 [Actinomycetota bacterium]|nr:50S ribosomal protein L30 [Actinomycetota bacterium]